MSFYIIALFTPVAVGQLKCNEGALQRQLG